MEDIKDFFRETPVFSTILSLLILGLIFILIDVLCSQKEPFSGIIVDKHYKAESTSVGTGVVNTGNGSGVVTTVETDPEKFLVMVKAKDGQIFTVECEPKIYYSKNIGNKIFCHHQIGLFTKSIWSSYVDF